MSLTAYCYFYYEVEEEDTLEMIHARISFRGEIQFVGREIKISDVCLMFTLYRAINKIPSVK